mmetsp:Transcript_13823/g.22794  ORF Transcript_13823/g.22794 Transcript_13823/m.22794 type:complete len:137 (+) Transcript_13823:479-889(+)
MPDDPPTQRYPFSAAMHCVAPAIPSLMVWVHPKAPVAGSACQQRTMPSELPEISTFSCTRRQFVRLVWPESLACWPDFEKAMMSPLPSPQKIHSPAIVMHQQRSSSGTSKSAVNSNLPNEFLEVFHLFNFLSREEV